MIPKIVETDGGATVIGGGEVEAPALERALGHAPILVAADGGADRALALGHEPVAAIGDFDSIGAARERLPAERLHHVAEQDSTDFEKCLARIRARHVIGVGFTGGRADHQLAAYHALLGAPMPVLLLDRSDVVFAAPPRLEIGAEPGMRVSLFPLAPVRGRSEGLRWPIDGLELAPGRRIGTSNEATARRVVVETEGPGLLVILPAAALEAALAALTAGAQGRR